MENTNVILATGVVADNIRYQSELLFQPVGLAPLTQQEAIAIVHRMMGELIEVTQAWSRRQMISWPTILEVCRPELLHTHLEILWPTNWTPTNEDDEPPYCPLADVFVSEILGSAVNVLDHRILRAIVRDTKSWDVFTLIPIGDTGDLILKNEGDYRIMDWMQRYQNIEDEKARREALAWSKRNGYGL